MKHTSGLETVTEPAAPPADTNLSPTPPGQKNILVWISLGLTTALVLIASVYGFYQTRDLPIDSPTPPPLPPNITRLIANQKIVFGTDATFPPMEYLDEQGLLTGYDIELGHQIAQELEVTPEFRNIEWDQLFDALLNGEIDAIISAVTINPERQMLYAFSTPYLNAGQVILTHENNSSIDSADDLAGKKIAVQGGTTNETTALEHTADEFVLRYTNFDLAAQALANGGADAVLSDLTNAKGLIDTYPELKIASDPITSDHYGVVLRPDEPDLVEKINAILESLKQKGVLTQLKQKWLE